VQAFANSYTALVTSIPLPTQTNIKWSKLLINGIPIGTSNSQSTYTSKKCHQVVTANNPSYATLLAMLKPLWVHPPTSYKADLASSLAVAFKNLDGKRLKSMLAARHLFAFGTRATIKKWKQWMKSNKPSANSNPA
jgi:hypothetical protein